MRLEVWKCSKTGVLIEHTTDWRRHLTRKAADLAFNKRRAWRLKNAESCADELRLLTGFDEISSWLETNGSRFLQCQIIRGNVRLWGKEKKLKHFRIFNVKFEEMFWDSSCSNTHCAPLGKRTNWSGQDKNEPRGYPGYIGNIEFEIENKNDTGFPSDIFRGTGICTGSGGSGCGSKYRFSVTLFAQDWPLLVLNDKKWTTRSHWNNERGTLIYEYEA